MSEREKGANSQGSRKMGWNMLKGSVQLRDFGIAVC